MIAKKKEKDTLNISLTLVNNQVLDSNYYYENTLKVAENCLNDEFSKYSLSKK
jgi:hypothetical protein